MTLLANCLTFTFILAEGGWPELIQALFEGAKGGSLSIVAILILLGTLKFLVPYYNNLKEYGYAPRSQIIAIGTLISILLGITFIILGFEVYYLINPPPAPPTALLVFFNPA